MLTLRFFLWCSFFFLAIDLWPILFSRILASDCFLLLLGFTYLTTLLNFQSCFIFFYSTVAMLLQ